MMGQQSNSSDQDDVSTRVSSKSQAQRSQKAQQKPTVNSNDYLSLPHNSETPRHISNKLDYVSRRYEVVKAEVLKPSPSGHLLPQLKPNSRLNSMDVERVERERRIASYLKPEPEIHSALGASRYARRNESLGVSRALGVSERKYEGVGQAIKLARAASQERIPVPVQYQPRGPCPVALMNKAEPVVHMPLQP
jgi:hypothetical protein